MIFQPWLTDDAWESKDHTLVRLFKQKANIEHTSALLNRLELKPAGVLMIRGPRQVGKSTLLRQFCSKALAEGLPPAHVALLDAESCGSFQELQALLERFLNQVSGGYACLCIDEVTSVDRWWKAVKSTADTGMLENCLVLMTGSSAVDLSSGADLMPGRRGRRYPLDFELKPPTYAQVSKWITLQEYYRCGAFPWAVNEFLETGAVPPFVFDLYAAWIQGSFARKGQSTRQIPSLLPYLARRIGAGFSVNTMARDCGLNSNHTGEAYLSTLLDNYALLESSWREPGSLPVAPRKNRKFYPVDPLLYHLFQDWGKGWELAPMRAEQRVQDPEVMGRIVETIVATHCERLPGFQPLGYFLGRKELDFAGTEECIEAKFQEHVTLDEYSWALKVLPKGMPLTVITKRTAARGGNIRLIPLEEWLLESRFA